MTNEMSKSLCDNHKKNPTSTQKDLQQWVKTMFDLQVSQAMILNTIKRSSEYLSTVIEKGDAKWHKPAKFPELENVLYEWFV